MSLSRRAFTRMMFAASACALLGLRPERPVFSTTRLQIASDVARERQYQEAKTRIMGQILDHLHVEHVS